MITVHLAVAPPLLMILLLAKTSSCDIHSHNQNVMLDRNETMWDPTANIPGKGMRVSVIEWKHCAYNYTGQGFSNQQAWIGVALVDLLEILGHVFVLLISRSLRKDRRHDTNENKEKQVIQEIRVLKPFRRNVGECRDTLHNFFLL